MRERKWSRRELLGTSAGAIVGALFAEPSSAAAPPPATVTPALIEPRTRKASCPITRRSNRTSPSAWANVRGQISRHCRAGGVFRRRADFPAHRTGAGQWHPCRDVANSTDPAHYLDWKKSGWLAPYLPEDVAKHFPADQVDPDGMYATSCAWMETIGYNTNLVRREDAPTSYADLLDPKWQGKIVKGHPVTRRAS